MEIDLFLNILFMSGVVYDPDVQIFLCALSGTSKYVKDLINSRYVKQSANVPDAYRKLLYYEIRRNRGMSFELDDYGDFKNIEKINTKFLLYRNDDHVILTYAAILAENNLMDKCKELVPGISSLYQCYMLPKALVALLPKSAPQTQLCLYISYERDGLKIM